MKKVLFVTFILSTPAICFGQQKLKTENVILITLDGLRWQEVFFGMDSSLASQQGYLKDDELKKKFWCDDISERSKVLLPFFWSTLSSKGQLYGNRKTGCKVNVSNNQWFSYPGYSEILTGHADDKRINSNDKIYNPNRNVLEFLNEQPAIKGKVVEDFGVPTIEVMFMEKLPMVHKRAEEFMLEPVEYRASSQVATGR